MSDPILVAREGAVAILTLNRPETLNALDGEAMYAAFETIFESLNRDAGVRAAILTGAGSAFCSGGNVAQMRDREGMFAGSAEQIAVQYRSGIQRIPRAFEMLEVPIIAAVNGAAIGAGCDLACMCDIRIAANTARFAESFVKLGIIPGDGGCWYLPRTVGWSRAAQMALTGDAIDAQEAQCIGLVSGLAEPDALLADALVLAQRIAMNSPQILRWTKRLMRAGRQGTVSDALDAAGVLQGRAHHTADHEQAVRAFFEKRLPVFADSGVLE